jgi:hypothetical protein|tara:strand:+ start:448 stop:663 length:216 start_codon:yes stop_codon:yes gene_type:complete
LFSNYHFFDFSRPTSQATLESVLAATSLVSIWFQIVHMLHRNLMDLVSLSDVNVISVAMTTTLTLASFPQT